MQQNVPYMVYTVRFPGYIIARKFFVVEKVSWVDETTQIFKRIFLNDEISSRIIYTLT